MRILGINRNRGLVFTIKEAVDKCTIKKEDTYKYQYYEKSSIRKEIIKYK